MDLAIGAKHVFVTMDHTTKQGEHRLLEKCSYPLTGLGVVDTVYTNLAIVDVHDGKFTVRAIADGLALEDLQKLTGAALYASPDIKTISLTQEGVPTLV